MDTLKKIKAFFTIFQNFNIVGVIILLVAVLIIITLTVLIAIKYLFCGKKQIRELKNIKKIIRGNIYGNI